MGLELDEAAACAGEAEPFAVSGRCSVFCKSDCTHAFNKGIPVGQVTAGLRRARGPCTPLVSTTTRF
jgi:activator of 2-hydroxyglutaryl-CoA dehydratase